MTYLCIVLFDLILIFLSVMGFYRYFNYNTFFGKYLPIHFKSSGALLFKSILLMVIGVLSLLSVCFKTLKSKQIHSIVAITRISRIYVFSNLFLLLFICLINALSIGFFYLNIHYIDTCLGLVKLNRHNHSPHDQL